MPAEIPAPVASATWSAPSAATKRDASKALAAMVAEVDQRPVGSQGKGTVAALCHEWLDHATPSFSPKTVETTRMYIEDPIIPALGSTQVAKLTPPDLDRFLSPAARSRSIAWAVRPRHHPTCARHHSTGLDPRGPLGLDHPQSGHRCLTSPGAHEGAEATGS